MKIGVSDASSGESRFFGQIVAKVGDYEVTVDRDTTVLLDAARARPVSASVQGKSTEMKTVQVGAFRSARLGNFTYWDFIYVDYPYAKRPVYVQQAQGVTVGRLQTFASFRLRAPLIAMRVDGQVEELGPVMAVGSPPPASGVRRLRPVDAGLGRPEDFQSTDVRGKLVLVRRAPLEDGEQQRIVQRAADAGAALVAFYNDRPGQFILGRWDTPLALPTVTLTAAEGEQLVELAQAPDLATVAVTGQPASPFVYDLAYPLRGGYPKQLRFVVSERDHTRLARIDQRFAALDGRADSYLVEKRYGILRGLSFVAESDIRQPVPSTRTDYVTAGDDLLWNDEVGVPGVSTYPEGFIEEGFATIKPGSRSTKTWIRQPLRPSPFDLAGPPVAGCQPAPVTRGPVNLRVWLTEVTDAANRFDCFSDDPEWQARTSRTMRLFRDGTKLAEADHARANFSIPADEAVYRLTFDNETSAMLPVSVRTSTTWTFRSAAPPRGRWAPVPLLLVDYNLPLDLTNRLAGDHATFTVRPLHGVTARAVASFRLWTSSDDGTTWASAPARRLGRDRFEATLPAAGSGAAISLRVDATDTAGNHIEQTIIRAYRT